MVFSEAVENEFRVAGFSSISRHTGSWETRGPTPIESQSLTKWLGYLTVQPRMLTLNEGESTPHLPEYSDCCGLLRVPRYVLALARVSNYFLPFLSGLAAISRCLTSLKSNHSGLS